MAIVLGTSSVFMRGFGHRLFFQIDSLPGYIEITKSGFMSFSYKCVINNRLVDTTSAHSKSSSALFDASISSVRKRPHDNKIISLVVCVSVQVTFVPSEEEKIAWYAMNVTRQSDLVSTVVHR